MSSNPPVETSSTTDRTHLFDSTFWQVLPTCYTKIEARWTLIARLYHEASAAVMATDRVAGTNSLKAELEMLETEMKEFRAIIAGIEFEDLVGLYIVAGRQRWRAEQIAKEDLEDLEGGLEGIEEKIGDVKADMVCGFKGR